MNMVGHNSATYGETLGAGPDRSQLAKEFWDFVNFIRCSGLPAPVRHVAIEIWIHMRPGKMVANPSATRIAQFTGLSERTVRSAFGALAKAPFFSVSAPQKGRGNTRTFKAVSFQTMTELGDLMDAKSLATLQGNDDDEGATVTVFQPRKPAAPAPFKILKPAPVAVLDGKKPAAPAPLNGENLQEIPRKPAGAAPEATLEATKKEKKGDARARQPLEKYFGKVASAVAAGITASVTPAAAAPPHPSEQVVEAPAECWQTQKAQMTAATNPHEAKAQKQVWLTPTGAVEIGGDFKTELQEMFPLVDLAAALAVAAPNVRTDQGAMVCMANVRRQFGYMQQDALRRKANADAYRKSQPGVVAVKPADMPDKIWQEIQSKRGPL